jgi:hypothetical protein
MEPEYQKVLFLSQQFYYVSKYNYYCKSYDVLTHASWQDVSKPYVVNAPLKRRADLLPNHTKHDCHIISIIPTDNGQNFKMRWYTGYVYLWMVSKGDDILYTIDKENKEFNYLWTKEPKDDPTGKSVFCYLKQGDKYVTRQEKVAEGHFVKLNTNKKAYVNNTDNIAQLIFMEETIEN